MCCRCNRDRADHALTILEAYESGDDLETNASDLIADILHALARNRYEGGEASPHNALQRALRHFEGESGSAVSYPSVEDKWDACKDMGHEDE